MTIPSPPKLNSFAALTPLVPMRARFEGRPTPIQMHAHISHKIGCKKYFSITTPPAPFLLWSPPLNNAHMETRACHCSKSRIHTLQCGHTVAVSRDAEQCAANCAGMPYPRNTEAGKKILDNTVDGFNNWAAYVESFGNMRAIANVDTILKVHHKMLFMHQRHRPDLVSGDFSCRMCGFEGHRRTVPAFELKDYFCVVVAKDEYDIAVIRELEKGVKPMKPEVKRALSGGYKKSFSARRGVLEGRLMKKRIEEKKKVTTRLREEILLEELGAMEI